MAQNKTQFFGPVALTTTLTTNIIAPAAVILASWYGGLGPAIFSVVLVGLGSVYFFVPPFHSIVLRESGDVWGLVGFLFTALLPCTQCVFCEKSCTNVIIPSVHES